MKLLAIAAIPIVAAIGIVSAALGAIVIGVGIGPVLGWTWVAILTGLVAIVISAAAAEVLHRLFSFISQTDPVENSHWPRCLPSKPEIRSTDR